MEQQIGMKYLALLPASNGAIAAIDDADAMLLAARGQQERNLTFITLQLKAHRPAWRAMLYRRYHHDWRRRADCFSYADTSR